MFALLLVAMVAPQPSITPVHHARHHSTHRHVRARRVALRTTIPQVDSVLAPCAIHPSASGCAVAGNERYRVREDEPDRLFDQKVHAVETTERRDRCGVVGMPKCPKHGIPILKAALGPGTD